MSLRFRRRIRILPGVHLNISKSGISTSVGVRGASVTLGKRGTYLNAGIPGTGISSRTRLDSSHSIQSAAAPVSTVLPADVKQHHLHWWKIALFLATLVIAGTRKSEVVVGLFWCAWLAYWIFLFVRMVVRSARSNSSSG
jgi:hypothetical protein